MMIMKLGKRLHRIAISVDEETFLVLSHMANHDRKELSTYVGHLVEEKVHGLKMKLPALTDTGNQNQCDRV